MEMSKASSESEERQKKQVWGKFLQTYEMPLAQKTGWGWGARAPNRADVRSAAQAGCHEQ